MVDNAPDAQPGTATCTCGCGCRATTSIPPYPVLARHARCETCAQPAHIAKHPHNPALAAPPAAPPQKFTPIYTPSEREKAEALESWETFKEEHWQAGWERWLDSLPAKYREATTKHPQVLRRLQVAQQGNLDVASLLVAGELGRGKTWIAAGYASDLIRSRIIPPGRALFTSEGTILTLLANSKFENQTDALARYASGKYRLIVIDDVGRGRWLSKHTRTALYHHLLDEQYKNNHLVVLTTNMQPANLEEWVGVAAYSRLKAMAGYADGAARTDSGLVFMLGESENKRDITTRHAVARAADTHPHPDPF